MPLLSFYSRTDMLVRRRSPDEQPRRSSLLAGSTASRNTRSGAVVFDPMYFLFAVPGLLLTIWAQSKVQGNYRKFSKVPNSSGLTGADVARRILDANGLTNVRIEMSKGELSDHYDPRDRTLRLSPGVAQQASVASEGIAAHEVGHAIQHATAYGPLKLRTGIVPIVSFASGIAPMVFIFGLITASTQAMWFGIILFAAATLFALITLPVEFDASKRAKQQIRDLGIARGEYSDGIAIRGVGADARSELSMVDTVLDAAAWTYIAAFASSLLQLLYFINLANNSDNR